MDEIQDPSIGCLQQTHFRAKDTQRLKLRGWKKTFHAKGNDEKVKVAILISEKVDSKPRVTTKEKKGIM